jgi:hypothetical protein
MEHAVSAPAEHPHRALADAGLPEHILHCRPGLVIGEIAGRDSIAALVTLARGHTPEKHGGNLAILPTIVATGTEYGDATAPARAIRVLRERVAGQARVFDALRLTSPSLWHALNGRFGAEVAERWGTWSPCLACHLYVHLCRVPLAWTLGATTIATGERDAHRGRLKLSQTPQAIRASMEVLAHAGIELLEPIQYVDDEEILAELVGPGWDQGTAQTSCVLSDNYVGLDAAVNLDESAHENYVAEFFVPVGKAVIDEWRRAGVGHREDVAVPDYETIVREVLEHSGGS